MKVTMAKILALLVIAASTAFAGDKYPLTMTAVYTEGHNRPDTMPKHDYTSGDYECTEGDDTHTPDCRTSSEWAELERIGGTPDTVLFTMADGAQVGVQSASVEKVYDTTCGVGTPIIFCDLYFKMLGMTLASSQQQGQFGQVIWMKAEEAQAAQSALHKKLFGNGNQMQVTMHYRLKGKPDKNGFQRIEVEGADKGITHILNPLGDGYCVKK
jgi:hypothetical protein